METEEDAAAPASGGRAGSPTWLVADPQKAGVPSVLPPFAEDPLLFRWVGLFRPSLQESKSEGKMLSSPVKIFPIRSLRRGPLLALPFAAVQCADHVFSAADRAATTLFLPGL